MFTPVNPSFTIQKKGLRGLNFYRYVFVMSETLCFVIVAFPGYLHLYFHIRIMNEKSFSSKEVQILQSSSHPF